MTLKFVVPSHMPFMDFRQKVQDAARWTVTYLVRRIRKQARSNAPYYPGPYRRRNQAHIRNTIKHAPSVEILKGVFEAEVFTTARHAPWVEEGTGLYSKSPHLIYPRRAKFMRFILNKGPNTGMFVRARFTRGQEAQPFMKPAWDKFTDARTVEKALRGRLRSIL